MKLTDRQILNLKPRLQRYEVWEGNAFGVRVTPQGNKSFVFMYRYQGKLKRMTLGNYPAVSLAEAHKAHAEAKEMLALGIAPGAKASTEKEEERKAPTVAGLADEYLEKWAKPRKRSWQADKRILEKDVFPEWGRRKAKDLTRHDVIRHLDNIVDRGAPIMANRTLAVIRKMFNFAVARDIVPASPCAAIQTPSREQRRDRVLSAEEIKTFWHGLERTRISEGIRLALKLQLVTAQRKGEVISAEWAEIDLQEKWWTIPAEKTKNRLPHRVPLSMLAIEILEAAKNLVLDSRWVFPSPRGAGHITPTAVDHALRIDLNTLEIDNCTPHDLRRTAASLMTGMGTSRLVVFKILNHVERGVTSVYDRNSYDLEKRQVLESWAHKLKNIIEGTESNVVPMVRQA
ncbi:MAG: tyrosine-type recombinase/integrase [Desulfobaccales bacterium]